MCSRAVSTRDLLIKADWPEPAIGELSTGGASRHVSWTAWLWGKTGLATGKFVSPDPLISRDGREPRPRAIVSSARFGSAQSGRYPDRRSPDQKPLHSRRQQSREY